MDAERVITYQWDTRTTTDCDMHAMRTLRSYSAMSQPGKQTDNTGRYDMLRLDEGVMAWGIATGKCVKSSIDPVDFLLSNRDLHDTQRDSIRQGREIVPNPRLSL